MVILVMPAVPSSLVLVVLLAGRSLVPWVDARGENRRGLEEAKELLVGFGVTSRKFVFAFREKLLLLLAQL